MLKKHAQIFQAVLFSIDMIIVGLSWIDAYFLRFYTASIPVTKGIPEFEGFLPLLLILLPVFAIIFRSFKLYEPMRSNTRIAEIKKVINASSLSTLCFITLLYLIKEYKYSRVMFVVFFIQVTFFLSVFRLSIRTILSELRKRGLNLRTIIIAGDGKLASEVARNLLAHSEYGLKVIGFLSKDTRRTGEKIDGIPILGSYADTKKIILQTKADQLILALPFEQIRLIRPILGQIYNEFIEIKIVPDLYEYFTLRRGIELLGDLPVINLRESPLFGWNRLLKRIFDISISSIVLFLTLPLTLIIIIVIKLSSKGPVFYKQQRMGLDGRPFEIIKFRSMKLDAEKETGPVWARKGDNRITKIGMFLRRLNLDELPQFYNVLKGEMSIVGPRPERPEFMQDFKKKIPEYMLRHKMKAGITGLAQIKGMRGNTSIEERTKYDLFYIENWSLFYDIKIFFRSFIATKNAY